MTDQRHVSSDAEDEALPARTNEPYDAPDAAALISVVRAYLGEDLLDRTEGHDRWLLRIAANALAIAEREIRLGPQHRRNHAERLASLGMSSDRQLAGAIRAGDLDHQIDEVAAVVKASVADSLDVANPDYSRP